MTPELVIYIILYLLLAISFFSFKEIWEAGVQHHVFYLFLSAILALFILYISFVMGIDYYIIGYIFTIPFICFFCYIFIRSLFITLYKEEMEKRKKLNIPKNKMFSEERRGMRGEFFCKDFLWLLSKIMESRTIRLIVKIMLIIIGGILLYLLLKVVGII